MVSSGTFCGAWFSLDTDHIWTWLRSFHSQAVCTIGVFFLFCKQAESAHNRLEPKERTQFLVWIIDRSSSERDTSLNIDNTTNKTMPIYAHSQEQRKEQRAREDRAVDLFNAALKEVENAPEEEKLARAKVAIDNASRAIGALLEGRHTDETNLPNMDEDEKEGKHCS